MNNVRRVLVTTDLSPLADSAIRPALDLAKSAQGKLILVHVMENQPPARPDPSAPRYKAAFALHEADKAREAELLKNLEERLRGEQGVDWTAVVARGDPIESILGIAEAERADLIVISSSGRTGLKRFLLGSVAEELARSSPLPVLLWKEPRPIRASTRSRS
jgi:nucleotide-binding universal stress UspA family protein